MFELKIDNGVVIPLKYTNWSLYRFSQLLKLPLNKALAKIGQALKVEGLEDEQTAFLDLGVSYALLQACYECAKKEKGEPVGVVDDFIVSKWVDQAGAHSSQLIEFYAYVASESVALFSKGKPAVEEEEAPNA